MVAPDSDVAKEVGISPWVKRSIGVLISLSVLAFTFFALRHHIHDVTMSDVTAAFKSEPVSHIELALLSMVISFSALAAYDVFAARIAAPGRVSTGLAILAGVAGNAVSNTLGFHIFTGGALRYRVYSYAGLSLGDVGRITSLAFIGLGLGYVGTIAIALWFNPALFLAAVLFAAVIIALLFYARKTRTLRIRRWTLTFPETRTALYLMAIGTIEMTAAAYTLYILLPDAAMPDFFTFILIYIGAVWLGVISHVPGGIGVFEATLMTALPALDRSQLLASLLLYRGIYNLLPFAVSCVSMLVFEAWTSSRAGKV